MDDDNLFSIGELSRRTGLTVKAIRFYSDRGIIAPARRTAAGHRRYAPDAVARLALVRALRELGLGLDIIVRVVDHEQPLGEVVAEHAAALDAQINVLRLRRAVLTLAAKNNHGLEEVEGLQQLAALSESGRQRLIGDFLDAVFAGPPGGAGVAAVRGSMTPVLPDDPTQEQLTAWLELAELCVDPEFRGDLRCLAEEHLTRDVDGHPAVPRPDVVATAREVVAPALASGIAPDSPRADHVVATLVERCALIGGGDGTEQPSRWLLHRLEAANDPRRERYLRLLALVNGWPVPEPLAPTLDWTVTALRSRTPRRTDQTRRAAARSAAD